MRIGKILFAFLIIFSALIIYAPNNLYSQEDLIDRSSPGSNNFVFIREIATGKLIGGIQGKGIYISNDNGITWTPATSTMPSLNPTDILFAGSWIYITTYGEGVFISKDNGASWTPLNLGLDNLYTRTITKLPNGILFVGTAGSGVYVSNDQGANWTQSFAGMDYRDVKTMVTTDNGYIVAGTYGGGIFVSKDTAKTWIPERGGFKILFINQVIYDNSKNLIAATNGRSVMKSGNDGISWAELDTFMVKKYTADTIPIFDMNTTCVAVDKKNQIVMGTRFGGIIYHDDVTYFRWVTSNVFGYGINTLFYQPSANRMIADVCRDELKYIPSAEDSWKQLAPKMAPVKNVIFPAKNGLFAGSDNGEIYYSTDDGKIWKKLTSVSLKPINAFTEDSIGNLYIATDMGVMRSIDKGKTWTALNIKSGGRYLDIKAKADGTLAVARWDLQRDMMGNIIKNERDVFVSHDNGNNWAAISNPHSGDSVPFTFITVGFDQAMYTNQGKYLMRSTDNGATWNDFRKFDDPVNGFYVTKDGIMYAATETKVYKSINNGSTWPEIPNMVSNYQSFFASANSSELYVYSIQLNAHGDLQDAIYRSTDDGVHWNNLEASFTAEPIIGFSSSKAGDTYISFFSGKIVKAPFAGALTAPVTLTPEHNQYDLTLQPEFLWKPAAGSELYQIEISPSFNFSTILEKATLGDTTYLLNGTLEYDREYYWHVRSKSGYALGPWSSTKRFFTMLPPPILVSPEDKSPGEPILAKLVWHKYVNATMYDIDYSTDKFFVNNVVHLESVEDTSIVTQPLLGLTTYYWRVKQKNENSTSEWSEVREFKTLMGPPVLISPAANAKNQDITLEFSWYKAETATGYHIQISETDDFANPAYDGPANGDSTHTIAGLKYFTQYFWRVSSVNANGESAFSQARNFYTGMSPVELISPEDGAKNIPFKPAAFKWMQHSQTNNYGIQISDKSDFSNIVDNDNVNDDTTYSSTKLEAYKDYFWRVRAVGGENLGIWSDAWLFKTAVRAPTLRSPSDGTPNIPIFANLIWYKQTGAAKYILQVANDDKFTDLVFSQDTITTVNFIFTKGLDPSHKYFWRVAAISPEGQGGWSEVWNFTTGSEVAPVLYSPPNNTTVLKTDAVNFSWSENSEAVSYNIQIAKDNAFSDLVADQTTTESSYQFTPGEEAQFYWRVRNNYASKQSPWSEVWMIDAKTTSVGDEILKDGVALYPNPASETVTIKLPLFTQDCYISVIDGSGKLMLDNHFSGEEVKLDTRGLVSGSYFVIINYGNKRTIMEMRVVK